MGLQLFIFISDLFPNLECQLNQSIQLFHMHFPKLYISVRCQYKHTLQLLQLKHGRSTIRRIPQTVRKLRLSDFQLLIYKHLCLYQKLDYLKQIIIVCEKVRNYQVNLQIVRSQICGLQFSDSLPCRNRHKASSLLHGNRSRNGIGNDMKYQGCC